MTTDDQEYSDIAGLYEALESARAGQRLALATAASGQERAEAAEAKLAETRDRLAKAELRLAAVEAEARKADPRDRAVSADRLLEICGGGGTGRDEPGPGAESLIRADERERVAREIETEAGGHLFTIRRAMRWAAWTARGKPAASDPGLDSEKARAILAGQSGIASLPCCPAETAAVSRAVTAERERIARLAGEYGAVYPTCPCGPGSGEHPDGSPAPFADLIREPS
jgi:hypothetical protein